MIGIVFCVVAFVVTYSRASRSLGAGFVSMLAFGYSYGLLRARIGDVGSHFIFDAALFGLYAASFSRPPTEAVRVRSQTARAWVIALVVWPVFCMFYSPAVTDAQPFIIQLVGLRAAIFMLPCLLLGARLTREDLDTLAPSLAIFNLVALGFALLEYVFGIEAFIPRSTVTDIVYASKDIAGASERFYRIPSTFSSSHGYGGTMVLSVPFVVHGFESGRNVRLLSWAGIGAAVIGVFLCGARLPVVMLTVATIYVFVSTRVRFSTIFALALTGGAVSYLVASLERFQRFTTLNDSEMVRDRLGQSMNLSFFDILANYPLGAGLASAAGTSIPYFLATTPGLHGQIGLESEYARLVLEEGILGLALWISFFAAATLRKQRVREGTPTANAYMHALAVLTCLVGFLGTGILFGIPSTPIFLMALGIRLADPAPARALLALRHVGTVPQSKPSPGALAMQRGSQ